MLFPATRVLRDNASAGRNKDPLVIPVGKEQDRAQVRGGRYSRAQWKFDAEKAPEFNYAELRKGTESHEMAGVLMDVGLLICWNVIFLLCTYISFIRYDVK